jgi:hypothetical protein
MNWGHDEIFALVELQRGGRRDMLCLISTWKF